MPARHLPRTPRPARGFQLVVQSGDRADGRYTVAVEEANGRAGNTRRVATVKPDQLEAAGLALADALRDSGHARTVLSQSRRVPIPLHEDAGVRLALAANTIDGVSKPGRASRLLDGVARLSDEECFYWYAHTLGVTDEATRRRRLKALRIFLGPE